MVGGDRSVVEAVRGVRTRPQRPKLQHQLAHEDVGEDLCGIVSRHVGTRVRREAAALVEQRRGVRVAARVLRAGAGSGPVKQGSEAPC